MGNPSDRVRDGRPTHARREPWARAAWPSPWLGLGLVLLVLLGLGPISCGGPGEDESEGPEPQGIHKTFKRGPVVVDLHLDRRELSIADQLHLTIEATASEDYEVKLPPVGEKLDQFGIVDYRTDAPVLVEENRRRLRRTYVLEPFLSGEYTVPEMTVQFWKQAEPDTQYELETEPLSVRVTSLLPEQLSELRIHDIQAPVNLPRAGKGWIIAGAILGPMALAGVVWILLSKRRKRVAAEVAIAAHELAYEQLEALIAEDLPGKGEIKLFYQRLSSILRHYIENRFALHAPEQTTEEFLGALRNDHHLSEPQKGLLRRFLAHCDLVKFAEHRPETNDIQETFDSCRNFIFETEEPTTSGRTQASPPEPSDSPPVSDPTLG